MRNGPNKLKHWYETRLSQEPENKQKTWKEIEQHLPNGLEHCYPHTKQTTKTQEQATRNTTKNQQWGTEEEQQLMSIQQKIRERKQKLISTLGNKQNKLQKQITLLKIMKTWKEYTQEQKQKQKSPHNKMQGKNMNTTKHNIAKKKKLLQIKETHKKGNKNPKRKIIAHNIIQNLQKKMAQQKTTK